MLKTPVLYYTSSLVLYFLSSIRRGDLLLISSIVVSVVTREVP